MYRNNKNISNFTVKDYNYIYISVSPTKLVIPFYKDYLHLNIQQSENIQIYIEIFL